MLWMATSVYYELNNIMKIKNFLGVDILDSFLFSIQNHTKFKIH